MAILKTGATPDDNLIERVTEQIEDDLMEGIVDSREYLNILMDGAEEEEIKKKRVLMLLKNRASQNLADTVSKPDPEIFVIMDGIVEMIKMARADGINLSQAEIDEVVHGFVQNVVDGKYFISKGMMELVEIANRVTTITPQDYPSQIQ